MITILTDTTVTATLGHVPLNIKHPSFNLTPSAFWFMPDGRVGLVNPEEPGSPDAGVTCSEDAVTVELNSVPPGIRSIMLAGTLNRKGRRYQFDGLGAYISLATERGTLQYCPKTTAPPGTRTMIFGALTRHGSGWGFEPTGRAFDGDVRDVVAHF